MSVSPFSAFAAALEKPIVKPVEWPEEVAADHPLRSLDFGFRYWPAAVSAKVEEALASKPDSWVADVGTMAFASTLCTKSGESIFKDVWPAIWEEHATANSIPPVLDENNKPVIPPIDYEVAGKWFEKRFDTKQGWTIQNMLWDQSLKYNGFHPTQAKN